MRNARFPLRAFAGMAALVAGPALACSVGGNYRPPTNVELVEQSDLVVLAAVEAQEGDPEEAGGNPYRASVLLKPIRAIKGELPRTQLKVRGFLGGRAGWSAKLEPTPLDRPHPSTQWGACIRQIYVQDGLVVATFQSTPEGFVESGGPFSRAVEDVEGPDGLWVRAADLYARRLRDHRGPERRAAFEAERRRLEADTGNADAQAIAADIAYHMSLLPPPG